VSRPRLDFNDPAAVRAWLVDLRVACDDIDSVLEDALKPERRRRLGVLEWKRLRREARGVIADLFAYALGDGDDDGSAPADPAGSGNGGAGPIH
jgi:hypothetical protein